MAEQNGSTTGQLLRREREKKKQSIQEAHAATKISIAVLRALEEDDVTAFPSDTYHKGFLRNYAAWLGLDGNRLWGQHSRRSEGSAESGGTFWDIEETIRYETSGELAGFIAEPIQGVGGVVTPPPEYFGIVYDIVRRHGGLCVADEVQTGFGRTGGKMFVHQPAKSLVTEYKLGQNPDSLPQYGLVGFSPAGTRLKKDHLVTLVEESTVDGHSVLMLELTPKSEKLRAAMQKIHLWIDQANWLPLQQRIFHTAADTIRCLEETVGHAFILQVACAAQTRQSASDDHNVRSV